MAISAKDFFESLEEFGGSWEETSREKMFPKKKDSKDVVKVKVVERESKDGETFNCMVFLMKGGKTKSHYLSTKSELEVGDVVDPQSVEMITLSRDGDEDIYRLDGEVLNSSDEDDE